MPPLAGQLGLDGSVRSVLDVVDVVRIAQEAGCRKFIVARDDFDKVSENIDISAVGANDLTAALVFLFGMHEPETTTPAPKVPTQGTPGEAAGHCAQCSKLLVWDRSGERLNLMPCAECNVVTGVPGSARHTGHRSCATPGARPPADRGRVPDSVAVDHLVRDLGEELSGRGAGSDAAVAVGLARGFDPQEHLGASAEPGGGADTAA
jgi:hypothetical protein